MKFICKPSPNFEDRPQGAKISLVVIHYTGMKSTEDALNRLTDTESKVSSHYLIDEDGNIYLLVDEKKRAWHAGVSYWKGCKDVNSASIGIELSNRGHEPFPDKQIKALTLLCRDLQHRYKIPPENFIGHSDVAPDRKQDPGPLFPWRKMAARNIGTWPKPSLKDKFNAAATAGNSPRMKALFAKAGYDTRHDLRDLVIAFQSRYEPRLFKTHRTTGKPTPATAAKLRALIRGNKKKPKDRYR